MEALDLLEPFELDEYSIGEALELGAGGAGNGTCQGGMLGRLVHITSSHQGFNGFRPGEECL